MVLRKTKHLIILMLSILLVHLNNCSRSTELPELDRYIEFKLERDHMPGLAIAIVSSDHLVWSKGYGLANIEKNIKVTPSTLFGTASITKSFTAAAIFQLYEAGKLDIYSPVNDYLPFDVSSNWH
ncbi:MAG: serine hydrolase, partial [Candidatus Heimdallarchaeota archaeon]|nr:serine hydrolase [Candidatus Heimdallarchaeota archaeon]